MIGDTEHQPYKNNWDVYSRQKKKKKKSSWSTSHAGPPKMEGPVVEMVSIKLYPKTWEIRVYSRSSLPSSWVHPLAVSMARNDGELDVEVLYVWTQHVFSVAFSWKLSHSWGENALPHHKKTLVEGFS